MTVMGVRRKKSKWRKYFFGGPS